MVLFSIWNATRTESGDAQTWCQDFGGEGVGLSCRSEALDRKPGILYSFRIDRNCDGWRATVSAAGETMDLGTIWNPALGDLGTVGINFIEQYGFGITCEKSPVASAIFYPPLSDDHLGATRNRWLETCGKGFVTSYRSGAFALLGDAEVNLSTLEDSVVLPLLQRSRVQQLFPT